MKALDVAKYVLSLTDEKSGNTISNLALQKLLYYIQGYYIACFDKPLFEEDIIAWKHGPVVKEVYNEYKKYKYNSIPKYKQTQEEKKMFSEEAKNIIKFVVEEMSIFSAKELENKTHNESPWKETKINDIISKKKLLIFFKTILEKTNEIFFLNEVKNVLKKECQHLENLPEYEFKYI